jgi:hypothetical protein
VNDENPGFQPLARTVEMVLAAIPGNYLPPLRMELNGCAARTRARGTFRNQVGRRGVNKT